MITTTEQAIALGSMKSEAKAAAVRQNGRLGGAPIRRSCDCGVGDCEHWQCHKARCTVWMRGYMAQRRARKRQG